MRLLHALLFLALLAAACGDDATEVSTGAPTPTPAAPSDLLLRIETGGGFVPVEVNLASFPSLVVADGTAWLPGAQILIYPPPAIPALQSAPLDDDDLRALAVRLEEAAPLFDGLDVGEPPVSDLPTTTVHAVVDGVEREVAVYGLDDEAATEGLTAEQLDARQQVRTLIADLRAIVDVADRAWEVGLTPEVRVSAVPVDPEAPSDDDFDQGDPVGWPEGVTEPAFESSSPFGCTVVTSGERDALLDAAQDTNVLTVWELSNGPHRIALRPLFPGEVPCP
jgi:hypothetical protein